MSNLRVIIAGGGTGGHIFPAIAIGHALQRLVPDLELLFVGALDRMEMEKIPQEGFKIIGLDIAGFNRSSIWKNVRLPFKILRSALKARSLIRSFNPQVVVGVGGYASFPVLNAAQGWHIPTLIQEQNSFAGRSNQILGKKANAVCVAYEHMDRFFPKHKIIMTGNPVRRAISESAISRADGQSWLGMDERKKTVLVVGGSLGAKSINEAIEAELEEIIGEDVQLAWQTGKDFYGRAMESAKPFAGRVKVFDFIREMDYAYGAADFVISRAGALAIAELCIVAKPVIFVPYPFAAEDHQTSNAMALVEHNAALMVKDNEARTVLIKKLRTLLHDESMQEIMIQNLKKLAIKDADNRIATQVIQLAEQNR